jgi:hypothetical protein
MAAGFKRASAVPPVPGGGRFGMLEVVLIAAIVILLLVLLVPFGAAMYQRMRARDEQKITERQPVARRQSVRVPPLDLAAPKQPAAPPPPAPAPVAEDATRVAKKDKDDTAPPAGQATELVQWYGMLLCTSGPLEGKRFMVEEDGFYIGRDATLSAVVIPDGRISKRHVRIVPRDGRAHAIDQDSTNGTFIGATTNPRITDVQLKRGDTIILGDNVAAFLYQV